MSRLLVTLLLLAGCAAPEPERPSIVDEVARVHGGAGPFAVAGYRMGQRALKELDVPRGSFALEVVHTCPRTVQWSCIADGLQAATGASPGKLNLTLTFVEDATATASRVRHRESGRAVVLTLTDDFLAKYFDTPFPRLGEAGREVAALPDERIFDLRFEAP